MERILEKLSKAIYSAISDTHPTHWPIYDVLHSLTRLENRPDLLTEMAYGWCSVIWENRQSCGDWETLLLLSLEIGFRHLDPQCWWVTYELTHTEHHQALADVVFGSKKSEAIADLLYAWTASFKRASTLLGIYAGHLISLQNHIPRSPRLRRLVIRSVEHIGYKGFEDVGTERFVDLLNCLHVCVVDMDYKSNWVPLLLGTIKSSGGARHLSNHSWELLVELAILVSRPFEETAYSSCVAGFLVESQEWDKLECWMGVIWMAWPPETDAMMEDLERMMVSSFRQRPDAAQKLEQWMKRWGQRRGRDIPESFQRICKRAYEAAQQNALYVPLHSHQVFAESHLGF